jgi:hypothetical protein
MFKAMREHGKQSIRSLADRTGLSKSSVHRHLQAMDRRDRSPESSLWETEAGRTCLKVAPMEPWSPCKASVFQLVPGFGNLLSLFLGEAL